MINFREKYGPWALITGASSGIGAQFAHQLAQHGLNLILAARRKERLDEMARELEQNHNIKVQTIQVDLSKPDFMSSINQVTDTLEIGLLVNNAGISVDGKFLGNNLEDELRMLDINCRAPLILAHQFGRKMAERKRGGIIFLASLVAFQGTPFWTNYAATKAHSLLLAEGLGYELQKEGVDVLALCPGFTKTEFYGDLDFSNFPVKPMDVKPVVSAALKSLGNRPAVIPGTMNRLLNLMEKYFLTRSSNTAIFGKMMGKVLGVNV